MEKEAQKIKSDWKFGKERMTERMNDFVKSHNAELVSEKELFQKVVLQRTGWIFKDLDCLAAARPAEKSLNCPWLMEFLISANLNSAEIEALKRAVRYHGWSKIPIHTFDALLSTKWEFDSIRGGSASYEPNDEIDRKRAAIALSYADLFITEGDLANLCQKTKVNRFCSTLVLSVRNPTKILETVRTMIGG